MAIAMTDSNLMKARCTFRLFASPTIYPLGTTLTCDVTGPCNYANIRSHVFLTNVMHILRKVWHISPTPFVGKVRKTSDTTKKYIQHPHLRVPRRLTP
jgi:hypothetical protein